MDFQKRPLLRIAVTASAAAKAKPCKSMQGLCKNYLRFFFLMQFLSNDGLQP